MTRRVLRQDESNDPMHLTPSATHLGRLTGMLGNTAIWVLDHRVLPLADSSLTQLAGIHSFRRPFRAGPAEVRSSVLDGLCPEDLPTIHVGQGSTDRGLLPMGARWEPASRLHNMRRSQWTTATPGAAEVTKARRVSPRTYARVNIRRASRTERFGKIDATYDLGDLRSGLPTNPT